MSPNGHYGDGVGVAARDDKPATDLYACRLTLRPEREGTLLPGSGRAIHAWWLDHLRRTNPALAERLHAPSARRPFACAPLNGLPAASPGTWVPVVPERRYTTRLSAWELDVVAALMSLHDAPPPGLMLGGIPFTVEAVEADPDTPPATFAGLAARHLLPPGAPNDRQRDVTLRFLTATSFRQPGTPAGRPAPVPFPLPAPLWGGLFDRWQEVAPVQLDVGVRDLLGTRVAVSRFEGQSQRVLLSGIGDADRRVGATGGQWVVGFVGRCTYWWPRRDEYLGGVLRLLAAFAGYAGVGHGTAFGLGQTRADLTGGGRS